MDIPTLDRLVEKILMPDLRLRNLNDLPEFKNKVPTTENLALYAERRLREHWKETFPARWPELAGVRILETARNGFETEGMRSG
jgi:6-pyruvoyl-tetrahydropterin synthase